MPLIQNYITEKNGHLAVWHITENEAFFSDKLTLTDTDRAELMERKGRRRLEWLAGKYLVQLMVDFKHKIVKDAFGKPHLEDSDLHISITHSSHFAAAIISPKAVGIDIQEVTPRLDRIAWRVMNARRGGNVEDYLFTSRYDAMDRPFEAVFPDGDRLFYQYNRRGLLSGSPGRCCLSLEKVCCRSSSKKYYRGLVAETPSRRLKNH